jgi:hypothetical protein
MAEPADEPHAVQLSGLLFEAADQQHLAIELAERRVIFVRDGRALASTLGLALARSAFVFWIAGPGRTGGSSGHACALLRTRLDIPIEPRCSVALPTLRTTP